MPVLRQGVLFVVFAASIVSFAGCENTIRGAGRDVSNTADAVETAAGDVAE